MSEKKKPAEKPSKKKPVAKKPRAGTSAVAKRTREIAQKAIPELREAKKAGRPPVYDDEVFPDMAFKFALLGATDEKMAEAFGIDVSILGEWKRKYPKFKVALMEGGMKADAEVVNALFHRAKGYSHKAVKIFCNPNTGAQEIVEYIEHYPPDVKAAQYWLNNRQRHQENTPWADIVRKEVTGLNGAPIAITDQSDDKARDNRAALLAQLGPLDDE